MVDGVLYMRVRNTGNAQLAWSEDHGKTWHWGFKLTTSFGSPAFLNFGHNYAGARDDFVYTYSQDGPSAYESSDALVLARVRKGAHPRPGGVRVFRGLDERARRAGPATSTAAAGLHFRRTLPARGRCLQSVTEALPAGPRI